MTKKIAFVHDRIYHMGGAESVMKSFITSKLQEFHDCKIMIFCGFSDRDYLEVDLHKIPIIAVLPHRFFGLFTYVDKHRIPIISVLLDYRNLMFFYPLITYFLSKKIDKIQFDEIHVDSFAFVKNISISQPITLYLHQPMQYIWSLYEHNLSKLKAPISWFYKFAAWYLRPWDKKKRIYGSVACNSVTTQKEAQKIYGIENSIVIYPPIDSYYLTCNTNDNHEDYYVFVGRIVIFLKDIDRIITLFNQAGKKIKIIGNGPDIEKLQKIAQPNIEFLGPIYGSDKYEIVGKARGLISLGRESFGMTAIEALCQGVPVLCYHKSASSEFMSPETGIIAASLNIDSLVRDIDNFENNDWNYSKIQKLGRERYLKYRQSK